jgi:hypothetical protein
VEKWVKGLESRLSGLRIGIDDSEIRKLNDGLEKMLRVQESIEKHVAKIAGLRSRSRRDAEGEANASERTSRASSKAAKSVGKTTQTVYQITEALQDATYTGFSGAANNLSFVANQIGGKSGLYGMLAVSAAVAIPKFVDAMTDAGDAVERDRDRLAELNNELQRHIDLREHRYAEAERLTFGPDMQNDARKGVLEHERGKARYLDSVRMQEAKEGVISEAQAIAKAISDAMSLDLDPGEQERQSEAILKRLEAFRDRANRAGILDPDSLIYRDSGTFERYGRKLLVGGLNMDERVLPAGKMPRTGFFGGDDPGLKEELDSASKLTEEARKRLAAEEQSVEANKRLVEQLGKLERHAKALDKIKSEGLTDRDLSSEASGFGTVGRQFSRAQREAERVYGERVKELESRYTTDIEDRLRRSETSRDPEERARLYRESIDLAAKLNEEVETEKRLQEGGIAALQTRAELIGRAGDETEKALRLTERGIESEKRLGDQIRRRVEQLERAKEAQASAFMGANFDSARSIERKKAEEERERLEKGGKHGLEAALKQNEALFAPQIAAMEQAERQAELARKLGFKVNPYFNPGHMKSGLTDAMHQRAEQIREFYERQQESGREGIEKRLAEREAAIQARNEKLLKDRATGLGEKGDLQGQMGALKELEGLQRQQAGQAQTSAMMERSFKEAERTQKQILDLYDRMAEKERAREAESAKRQADLTAKAEDLRAKMEEIAGLSIIKTDDAARADAIRQSVEKTRDAIKEILDMQGKGGLGDVPAGDPLASAGVGGVAVGAIGVPAQPSTNVTNTTTQTTVHNHYSANVNGIVSRPSLTLGEVAQVAARHSKNASMRSGLA